MNGALFLALRQHGPAATDTVIGETALDLYQHHAPACKHRTDAKRTRKFRNELKWAQRRYDPCRARRAKGSRTLKVSEAEIRLWLPFFQACDKTCGPTSKGRIGSEAKIGYTGNARQLAAVYHLACQSIRMYEGAIPTGAIRQALHQAGIRNDGRLVRESLDILARLHLIEFTNRSYMHGEHGNKGWCRKGRLGSVPPIAHVASDNADAGQRGGAGASVPETSPGSIIVTQFGSSAQDTGARTIVTAPLLTYAEIAEANRVISEAWGHKIKDNAPN